LEWGSSSRLIAIAAALWLGAAGAGAEVFLSQQEALALAFPEADRVETRTHVLTDEQAARIEALSRGPLDSKLVRIHTGWRGEEVLGYALIDVHVVRTLSEALLVVLSPAGEVRNLRVLAFHEPPDYLPKERWYAQFEGKTGSAPLRIGGDLHGVVGATLSSRAAALCVRRALACYEVLIRGGRAG
jgi:hypothetical protein